MITILTPARRRNLRRIDAARLRRNRELGISLALALLGAAIYAFALIFL
jgi:hypothetical protein